VIYAFCREADDIVDEPGEDKPGRLERFREGLHAAYRGEGRGPIFTGLAAVLRTRPLTQAHLEAVIDGCAMDLHTARYETFADLAVYLDRVSCAVGRAVMEALGVDPRRHAAYAEAGGYSVQLTNILRDVKEDLDRDRIYLPLESLRRHGVTEADLRAGRPTEAFVALMQAEAERARGYYAAAHAAIGEPERRKLLPLTIVSRLYERRLGEIEAAGFDVLRRRPRLSSARKLAIALGAVLRAKLGLPIPR
jgi:phytoene synthase